MKSDININNKDCLLNWKEFEISRLFTIKSPAARTIKLILSILVDTFISKISFPMQPGPEIGSISDA